MRTTFFILIFIISIKTTSAQVEKLEAAYIYNFTKQMNWPDKFNIDHFTIGVFGNKQAITDELMVLTGKRKVGNKLIKVEVYHNIEEIQPCHILFVPKQQSAQLSKINNKLGNAPTAIITEDLKSVPKESTINLHVEGGRLTFSINKNNAELKQITIGDKLYTLAKK